jgi:protease-4
LRLLLIGLAALVFPLALGLFLAPRLVPRPKVGIIRLSYDIFSETAQELTDQLDYARQDDSVKAVVLILNSPGGSAAFSEELFLATLNAQEDFPVVASIDLVAASGAYYMAAGADEIYAKPTSAVGSIGVITTLSDIIYIEDEVVTTGPYKAFGGTRDGSVRQIERAKFAFLEAVRTGRGERLRVDLDYLSRAEIYTGVQALEMGLIDGLLSTDAAVARAAELAGISNYEVAEMYPLAFGLEGAAAAAYQPAPIDEARLWAPPVAAGPGPYARYYDPAWRR